MSGGDRFNTYRGKSKSRKVLTVVAWILAAVLVLAVGFYFYAQQYVVYDDQGNVHLQLPFFRDRHEPEPTPDHGQDIVVVLPTPSPTPAPTPTPEETPEVTQEQPSGTPGMAPPSPDIAPAETTAVQTAPPPAGEGAGAGEEPADIPVPIPTLPAGETDTPPPTATPAAAPVPTPVVPASESPSPTEEPGPDR